jgi:hypothetical protein
MVATERKSFWSPHPLIRYICVGSGYRQDDRPTVSPHEQQIPRRQKAYAELIRGQLNAYPCCKRSWAMSGTRRGDGTHHEQSARVFRILDSGKCTKPLRMRCVAAR